MVNPWEYKYHQDALFMARLPRQESGRTGWECPSNIALVKYWGKRPVQLPLNPSASFVLREARTILSIDYSADPGRKQLSMHYIFDSHPEISFKDRFYQYLKQLVRYLPFLNHTELVIRAQNTFPHSAGLASSASSFGALALSLCSIEKNIFGTLGDEPEFMNKASFLARLGSGSACRSVYGGFSLWGNTEACEQSADEVAISLYNRVHPVFQDYCDSILVIHSGKKEVSSSAGHQLMDHHPYFSARILQANENIEKLLAILTTGDESGFVDLVEEEALSLHAMMMTSRPGYILMKPPTIEVISRIRQFRNSTGLPVSFTLDAGANIHILYSPRIRLQIISFILSDLSPLCEDGRVIHDEVGNGPVKIS